MVSKPRFEEHFTCDYVFHLGWRPPHAIDDVRERYPSLAGTFVPLRAVGCGEEFLAWISQTFIFSPLDRAPKRGFEWPIRN